MLLLFIWIKPIESLAMLNLCDCILVVVVVVIVIAYVS